MAKLIDTLKQNMSEKDTKITYNVKLFRSTAETIRELAEVTNMSQSDLVETIFKEQKIEEILKKLKTENKTI